MIRVSSRLLLTLVLAAAIAVGLTAPSSQAVPPGGPSNSNKAAKVTVSPKSVKAGGKLTVSGSKFPKSTTVTIKLDDQHILTTFKTNKKGSFSGKVTVPKKVKVGSHWLRFLAPKPNTSIKGSFKVKK